jgi:transcriptional regulator with XRE-family HTH domain
MLLRLMDHWEREMAKEKKTVSEDRSAVASPAVQTMIARVEERVNANNLSRTDASRRAGLGLGYVTDLLSGKLKTPSRHAMAKLGQVLDTDVGYFFGEQDTPRRKGSSALTRAIEIDSPYVAMPLYQVGLPDADGFFALDEAKKGVMVSSIGGANGLYCVVIPDDTMEPRYLSGEVVIVNPNRQASKGGFAVVRHADGRVAIREIVAIAPDKITVRSLMPDQVVDLQRADIKSLDRIIGSCEQ